MGDPETKNKRSQSRRRDFMAKHMNELHRPKIIDPRKEQYKRVHLRPQDIGNEDEQQTTGENSQ